MFLLGNVYSDEEVCSITTVNGKRAYIRVDKSVPLHSGHSDPPTIRVRDDVKFLQQR